MAGSPGQGFQREDAATGIQLQAVGGKNVLLQPVEKGFPYPVPGRSKIRNGSKTNFATSPISTDNSNLASGCVISWQLMSPLMRVVEQLNWKIIYV